MLTLDWQLCAVLVLERKMGFRFWFKRAVFVYCGIFVVLMIAELIKQNSITTALEHSLLWAAISTAIFIMARFIQSKQGIVCDSCQDFPKPKAPSKKE